MRRQTARLYLAALSKYCGSRLGKLLGVGCGNGEFLAEASLKGFDVSGLDVSADAVQTTNTLLGREVARCSTIERAGLPDHHFDVCVCGYVIEHTREPLEFLSEVHHVLKPDGVLLLVTAASGSRPVTLENALLRTGFRSVEMMTSASRVLVLARARVRRPRPLVSVIVPVHNEHRTVARLLETLTAKELTGADKEIIVVESNSNDGSRVDVLRFAGTPGVQIVLQDRPLGKGSAVRQGLRHARGDIILIQDADLEYEIDDYDSVIEPVRTFQCAVVLGSRHSGNGKIRVFADQWLLGLVFNSGHVILTGLFNLLYRQALKDPWTMYKVFRSDCLHNLKFECNRFNFDVELLAKLIRKGHTPLEVPVNYRSRSFKEGKKIRVISDPWTWVWACLKYRVVSPYGGDCTRRTENEMGDVPDTP